MWPRRLKVTLFFSCQVSIPHNPWLAPGCSGWDTNTATVRGCIPFWEVLLTKASHYKFWARQLEKGESLINWFYSTVALHRICFLLCIDFIFDIFTNLTQYNCAPSPSGCEDVTAKFEFLVNLVTIYTAGYNLKCVWFQRWDLETI